MYEDGTRPYSPQTARVSHHIFRHSSPRLVIFAAAVALLGLALSAASVTLFLSFRASAETQIRQLQQQVTSAQAGNRGNAYSVSGLAGKVSSLDAGMAALAPFNQVCATDLTNASGQPAAFWFLCSAQKPGG